MVQTKYNLTLMFLLFAILFISPAVIGSNVYFVDATFGDDTADGRGWETANRTIGAALEKATNPGDQIRVAAGLYVESIVMNPGIQLTGGYEYGGDTSDPLNFETIIDGDNTHRCIEGADGAVLSGFIIQNGWSSHGSGILHNGITMTVSNCIFRYCIAYGGNPHGGGAMFFFSSQSRIIDCEFYDNHVITSPDSPSLESMGGAVKGWSSAPEFYRCSFTNNSVKETPDNRLRMGGAIWFISSRPVIRKCVFEGNSAITGGAIGWWNRSRPTVEDSVFRNNHAESFGGAIAHIFNERDIPEYFVYVRNCRFENNTADRGAGMAVLRNNRLIIDNCLFANNRADSKGAGLYIGHHSILMINHATFADNYQNSGSTGVACIDIDATSYLSLNHSIIADNELSYGIHLENGGDPLKQEIRYTNVYGHYENYSDNLVDRTGWAGNISKNPRFTHFYDDPYCLSEPQTGDPRQIQLGRSPCIDAGEYDTEGYPAGYSSTRTDKAPDTGKADLGFHRYKPGPRYIPDYPVAGEHSVPEDAIITGRLHYLPASVTVNDINVRLNNVTYHVEFEQISDGYRLILEKPGGLYPDTDYLMETTVFSNTDIWYFPIVFSTAEQPGKKEVPIGASLQLDFPITQEVFSPGDLFDLDLDIYNPWLNPVSADIHILFEYGGVVFIYPLWTNDLNPVSTTISAGATKNISILTFTVPDGIGVLGPVNFYAAAMAPDTFVFISKIAEFSLYFIE